VPPFSRGRIGQSFLRALQRGGRGKPDQAPTVFPRPPHPPLSSFSPQTVQHGKMRDTRAACRRHLARFLVISWTVRRRREGGGAGAGEKLEDLMVLSRPRIRIDFFCNPSFTVGARFKCTRTCDPLWPLSRVAPIPCNSAGRRASAGARFRPGDWPRHAGRAGLSRELFCPPAHRRYEPKADLRPAPAERSANAPAAR